ncbi:MAG: N-acetyltransferase [Bacteroidales bacterium]|nr:N-acetyltransferase [Bacteroidales bacterium]
MIIDIQEVRTTLDRKTFVNFQFELYKSNAYWVPPVRNDEIQAIDPDKNPAFEFCKAKFWLAVKEGSVVGRIGAIINNAYNEKVQKPLGRINRVEFLNDKTISETLFNTAIEWLKSEGCTQVHGPLGFTNLDTQGLLIEGFDYLPSIASVYHMPYYEEHFNELGFEKENDWVEFRLTLTEHPVNKASRGADLIKRRFGFTVKTFNNKKEMQAYAKPIFNILNESFKDLPYVNRFNDKLIDLYSKKYFKVLDYKFVRVVEKEGEIVGFVVGLPSLSRAMQKAKGKLFPFGFFHILKALKSPKEIDLLLTGVVPEHQSAGVAVILFAELQQQMLDVGIKTMETTGIFETNHNVISNWKNYENIQHKRRRCYTKNI